MNKSALYIALAASTAFSGSAIAATNASSTTALAALPTVDTTWIVSAGWASIDPSKTANTGAWDASITGASDPCGDNWAGIYCDGNDITHIEIPNASMNGTIAAVYAALAPIKTQLVSINLSSTIDAEKNVLSGAIPTDGTATGYTALRYLGLNYIGASGDIPDMSSNSALTLANFYGNSFSTYTGPVGGANLHFLGLHGNDGMVGDLGDTLDGSLGLITLSSYGTALTGGLNGVENIILGKGSIANSLDISWSMPSEGVVPDSYGVALTDDDGDTWQILPDVTTLSASAAGLADGTYIARITPKTDAGLIGSVQAVSDEETLDSTGSGGTDSSGGGSGNTGGNTNTGDSDSGGGAAFWLLALTLVGFSRRSR